MGLTDVVGTSLIDSLAGSMEREGCDRIMAVVRPHDDLESRVGILRRQGLLRILCRSALDGPEAKMEQT